MQVLEPRLEMSKNVKLAGPGMFMQASISMTMQASQHTKVYSTDLYKKNTGHVVFFFKKKEKYAKFQK
jgi:hypothetical protein